MRAHEAGYTIVELLIGAAIAAVIVGGLVGLASRLALWTTASDTRVMATAATERLFERLGSEASSAWAVFVPATDVSGASNADGHEIDFYSEDGSHRSSSWAYTYDATAKTVTRYALASGSAPVAGEVLQYIDAFSATTVTVSRIGANDPLFAGASATDVAYAFAGSGSAVGGNALVQLHVAANGVDRTTLLASATAPTSFTVVVQYTPSPTPVITPSPTPLVLTAPTPTP